MESKNKKRWGILSVAIIFLIIDSLILKRKSFFLVWLWFGVIQNAYNGNIVGVKRVIRLYVAVQVMALIFVFVFIPEYAIYATEGGGMNVLILQSLILLTPKMLLYWYAYDQESRIIHTEQSEVSVNENLKQFLDIADIYWEKASLELGNKRNEAVWAKAFALSEGDEAKSKAMYIKLRAKTLQFEGNQDEMDYLRNKSFEDLVKTNNYLITEKDGVEFLEAKNGQVAIKIKMGKYRLYDNKDSVEKSLKYYKKYDDFLNDGFIREVEINYAATDVNCPICKAKNRVQSDSDILITCSSCKFEWKQSS